MKKYCILYLVLILISKNSIGQITKGNWMMGGSGSYTKEKIKTDAELTGKYRDVVLTPSLGYFFIDKMSAGVRVNTGFSKQRIPQPDGSIPSATQSYYGFGPFIRYYFLSYEKRINIFTDASTIYTINTNNSNNIKSKLLKHTLATGTVIFLNDSVGLEALLVFNKYSNSDADVKTSEIQFKVGFQIHLEKE